jgi:regulator of sirC expression with transglutaminase-like and TPR domain
LNGEIGGVDTMLNAIDARLKRTTTPSAADALRALRARLTMDPRNIEDLRAPAQLRERLLDLLGRINGTSYQAPNAAQSEEARALHESYAVLSAAYAALQ